MRALHWGGGILLAGLACAPAAAQDRAHRDFATDRPDKTENPHTVDAGMLQLEMDVATFTSDVDRSADTLTHRLNLAPFNLKLGLDANTDVQLVFDSFLRETVTDRTTRAKDTTRGIGDVTLRLKRNLWGNDEGATAFAVMPFVKLPTNSNGLGNGSVEFGIIAPLAIDLSERIGLTLMTEVDMVEQDDGSGLTPSFIDSASLGFELSERLGVYSEIFTEKRSDSDPWAATVDVGTTFQLAEDLQLDAGANIGVTDAADDVMLFLGISGRF